jgi:glycosyltransferase involved in cell wall biosynthesis
VNEPGQNVTNPPAVRPEHEVLLVGKGPPDRGGIAASIATLEERGLGPRFGVRVCNLTRPDEVSRGGRFSVANVTRTLADVGRVWQESRDVDVVDVHSAAEPAVTLVRAGLLAATARLRGAKVIVHAHGGRIRTWLTRRRWWLARAALAPAHRVVAVAEGERAALAAALRDRDVALIPNGVDTVRFRPPSTARTPGPTRILYVGLLTPRKGVLDLLAASDLLARRGLEHEVHLIGGTPDEGPEFEEEVRRAATPRTVLHGALPREEMPARYREGDVFCLPSWWESMPLSVLEAMSSGLPVVATAVGDVPSMVDAEVGAVVPPRSPDALANALTSLLQDGVDRARRAAAARQRAVTRYGLDASVQALGAVVDELVGDSGDRRLTSSEQG